MSFPSVPPAGLAARAWSFPPSSRRVLDNGLVVMAVRVGTLPLVQLRWSFRAGRPLERHPGGARILAQAMRHGTRSHNSHQLAEVLDDLGAVLHASIALDNAVVTLAGLTEHTDVMTDLLDEVVFHPRLAEADITRERAKALQVHHHERAQPDHLAASALGEAIYGDHVYGMPNATHEGLEATSRDDLLALHDTIVRAGHGLVLAVGDLDPDATVERLSQRYAGLQARDGAVRWGHPTPRPARVVVIDRPASEQVTIALGSLAFPRRHPDFLPLRVTNQVLGANASSRLFQELRERRSLTYGVTSSVDCGLWGGDFTASLSCAPAKLEEALSALLGEVARAHADPVDESELDRAKKTMIGSFPQKAAGLAGMGALLNLRWLHDLPARTWETWQQRVADVTADEAAGAARRWLDPAAMSLVVVGPRDVCETAVADLGPVELRTADAEP